jgi:Arm DNA-binding domain
VFVRDCECTGLVVRVQAKTTRSPQGRRTYLFVWSQGGVEKGLGIGRSCDYTVAEARTRARELRQAVNRGEDPRRDRRAKRERKTVADLIARFERDHMVRKKAPRVDRSLIAYFVSRLAGEYVLTA